MNIYRYQFVANCPTNDKPIIYSLSIETEEVIYAEHLMTACALIESDYHEDIADKLSERFKGVQTLKANHHGVDIETRRTPEFGRLKQRVQVGKTVYEQGVDARCAISHIVSDSCTEA
jgi:hypothetical protein